MLKYLFLIESFKVNILRWIYLYTYVHVYVILLFCEDKPNLLIQWADRTDVCTRQFLARYALKILWQFFSINHIQQIRCKTQFVSTWTLNNPRHKYLNYWFEKYISLKVFNHSLTIKKFGIFSTIIRNSFENASFYLRGSRAGIKSHRCR